MAQVEAEAPSLSAYGGIGLLDTRSARMLPDGTLSFTASIKEPDDRIALGFQALPWLETTFRYSVNYAGFAGDSAGPLYDRSFDVKLRLLEEGEFVPELALGFQDIVGTGIYAGEFLVGSKRLGRFDVSLGLGWGRLASRGALENPFGLISDRFETRPAVDGGEFGGSPRFGSFFRGPDMGVFGGVEYATPWRGLRLQAEYSSDSYLRESRNDEKDYGFPVNLGVSYRLWPAIDFGIAFMHGRELAVRISTSSDLTTETNPIRLDRPPRFQARPDEIRQALFRRNLESNGAIAAAVAAEATPDLSTDPPEVVGTTTTRYVDLTTGGDTPPPLSVNNSGPIRRYVDLTATRGEPAGNRPPTTAQSSEVLLTPLRQDLAGQGLTLMGAHIDGERIDVAVENERYRRDAEALARTVRVLSARAPPEVETFEITEMRDGQPLVTAEVPRDSIDHLALGLGSPEEVWRATTLSPGKSPEQLLEELYPRFSADLRPVFRQSVFDPDNPLYLQFGVGVSAHTELWRGFTIDGLVSASLYDNFGDIRRQSDSVLPHVRSDAAEYLTEGKYGLNGLTASYQFKLTPEIYATASAGYLEWMFAGAGGEVLYRPFRQRWAVGVDVWAVQQRDFNQRLGLQSYRTLTGHISAYYDAPFYNLQFAVRAGRYLARDYGVTFEASRRFRTGVRVGAWFTLTNVSSERFGEGSFDKGIRLVIPLEWVVPFGTQSQYELDLRPVQRDGGQMLAGTRRLYDLTDQSVYGAMADQWGSVFRR